MQIGYILSSPLFLCVRIYRLALLQLKETENKDLSHDVAIPPNDQLVLDVDKSAFYIKTKNVYIVIINDP